MFPQLRQRIGPALDLIVEFSTLGEYRLDAEGVLRPASALAPAAERVPQLRSEERRVGKEVTGVQTCALPISSCKGSCSKSRLPSERRRTFANACSLSSDSESGRRST